MAIDPDRIDDAVLALMWLTLHDERRAWNGFDWDTLARLHARGMIADPVNKAKSVVLTDDGLRLAEERFHALFTKADKFSISPIPVPSLAVEDGGSG